MAQETKQEKTEEEIRYFVRIGTTDLDGTKTVRVALTGIRGIGRHSADVIARLAGVGTHEILGKLGENQVEKIRKAVDDYAGSIPWWMANRPRDTYTGESRHLLAADVQIALDEDVNVMRKIRCYRGIRHETGQKVRGQRTKSTGRTGTTVGVKRKKE
jgi:small subunit ribosomal protein S13